MSFDEKRLDLEGRVGWLVEPKARSPLTQRVVVLCHGQGGHSSYLYQSMLSRELASTHQLSSFRFDFRDCGDSCDTPEGVRGFEQDFEDLQLVLSCLRSQYSLRIFALVGHSRGALACLLYACLHDGSIPHIVNCSGRYNVEEIAKYHDKAHPSWRAAKGFRSVQLRYGRKSEVWVPSEEINRIAVPGTMDQIARLPKAVNVLTIYGLADSVISIDDCTIYANKLADHHTLHLIPKADHNFFELTSSGERINHNSEVSMFIASWLSDEACRLRFAQRHQHIVSLRRWRDVPDITNFRDLGGYQAGQNTVRRGWIFRSADPSKIRPNTYVRLYKLGIRVIYDLRSSPEIQKNGFADIKGIRRVEVPVLQEADYSPAKLSERYAMYGGGCEGFLQAYETILANGGRPYRTILEHLRDKSAEGMLIHCTGIICALILSLAGCTDDIIAREYELTSTGLAGEHEKILAALASDFDANANKDAVHSMMSSTYKSMMLTLKLIREKYGNVEGYLQEICTMSPDDLAVIKKNLLVSDEESCLGWMWKSHI